jgi:uncharacterized low-complexity protein
MKKLIALAGVATLLLGTGAANADSWTRTYQGPNGASRTVNGSCGNGSCNRTVTGVGPNGATRTRSGQCSYGKCSYTASGVGPHGRSWSSSGGVVRGPYHGYAYRTVTGPAGQVYARGRVWRRW